MLTSPILPGEMVAKKYRVERILGQGGMGIVVAAWHLELEQSVAIKFLVGSAPPNAVERFLREARAAALVKSEHVCRVFDVGRLDTGEPYIVMEHLEGIDLAEKLDSEGRQALTDVVGWTIEACDALSSAHAQGIVHRDLKPANLFLQQTADGTKLKLLDFGISKMPASGAGALTATAVMMGSPLYMSPEQLESSRSVDLRSDIWSLGVVLYELLAGVPPFGGDTLVQLAVQAREREPELLTNVRPDIPEAVAAVIARCLAKKPSDRYGDVCSIVVDLAPYAPQESQALVAKLTKRGAKRASDPQLLATVQASSSSSRSAVVGGRTPTPAESAATSINGRPTDAGVAEGVTPPRGSLEPPSGDALPPSPQPQPQPQPQRVAGAKEDASSRRRRAVLVACAAAVVVVIGIVAGTVRSSQSIAPAPMVAGAAARSTVASAELPLGVMLSAEPPRDPPTTSAEPLAPAAARPAVPAAVSGARSGATRPNTPRVLAPAVASTKVADPVSSAPPVPSASTRRKRELDRSYEP